MDTVWGTIIMAVCAMVHEDGTVQQIRRNETLHDLFATLTYPELHENVDKLEK